MDMSECHQLAGGHLRSVLPISSSESLIRECMSDLWWRREVQRASIQKTFCAPGGRAERSPGWADEKQQRPRECRPDKKKGRSKAPPQ